MAREIALLLALESEKFSRSPMQPLNRIFAVVGSVLIGGIAQVANGQAPASRLNGVKFTVAASIQSELDSHGTTSNDGRREASLAVNIRISAHAIGSEFYGIVSRTFSNISGDGARQIYWQDAACHQKRGYPKTTITSIDGSISIGEQKIVVRARARHIGLPLPDDEITPGIRLPGGADDNGKFIAYRSTTSRSHLFIEVRTYMKNCEYAPQQWHFHTLKDFQLPALQNGSAGKGQGK